MGFFKKKNKKYNTDYLNELRNQELTKTDDSEDIEREVNDLPKSADLQQNLVKEQNEEKISELTLEQKKQRIESCCDRVVEANRRIDEFKVEYQAVNAYLTDIQLIENLPTPQKEELVKYAKKVVVLDKDRKDFGRSMSKLSNRQYSHMRECEDNIKDILKNMSDDENYCQTVKTDMRYLEGERAGLKYVMDEMKDRIYLVKAAAKIGIISFAILIILLLVLNYGYSYDTSTLIYIVVAIAAVAGTVLFTIHNNALNEIKISQARENKTIILLNKIKVKYVNVVSRLEYMYELHGVKSAYQLNKVWATYMQLKKEHEVYNKASNRLIEAEEGLVKILEQSNVKDCNVWITQAYAIIDSREMDEIKFNLNKRRHKLKATLDYNNDTAQLATDQIKNIIMSDKEHARELMAVVDANC